MTVYRNPRPDGEDAETPHQGPNTRQSGDDDTPAMPSGLADSADESHEAPPTIDFRDRLVTPATARRNSTGEPVPLHRALATWSDGTMYSHTQIVREKVKRFTDARSTCTDHPADRKTCPNCKQAKGDLDSAKRRGGGHLYTGHFTFRHRYGLVAFSGVIPLDFDHLDDPEKERDQIATLPYIEGSRVSVSGTGVHALVCSDSLPDWDGLYPPEQFVAASQVVDRDARRAAYQSAAEAHPQWVWRIDHFCEEYTRAWHRAVKQVRMDLGLFATADDRAKDLARLLYDCHDADARINLRPVPLPSFLESEGAPPPDLVSAALHALISIHPPADTSQWMRLVYHCKAIGVPEQDVDAWSRKGDRYEKGELELGEFLCYQTIRPEETAEEALASLQAEAASQDTAFIPLKVAEEIDAGFTGGADEQGPATETNVSNNGRTPVFAGKDLAAEVKQVIQAIVRDNEPPRLFGDHSATSSWELTGTAVREVSQVGVGVIMSESCRFLTMQKKGPQGKYQPQMLVNAVHLHLPRELPVLNGVKTSPFYFRGQLVTISEGFHAPSGYYCQIPDDLETGLEVAECISRLDDLLGEFPYVQGSDRANAFGLLIGQLLKPFYLGPMVFIDKPASQTGATILARTIASVSDGREPEVFTASTRPEETDKRLNTALQKRPSSIVIDNISSELKSDVLASGMTNRTIGGRLLGGNTQVQLLTRGLQFYLTGNNGSLERDLINRSINVRLDSGLENPEERSGFRHVLPHAALEWRSHYMSAVASLVQRWIDAGGPMSKGRMLDTYGTWMRATGGILEVAGVEGFNENRPDFKRRADTGGETETRFLEAWLESGRLVGVSPGELLPIADGIFTLNGDGDDNKARSLGHRLRKMADKITVLNGRRYAVRRDRGNRSAYTLEEVEVGLFRK